MNNTVIKKSFFRRPLVAFLLPILICTLILVIIWHAIYSPKINENQISFLKLNEKVKILDISLKEKKMLRKKIEQYHINAIYTKQFNLLNRARTDFLSEIITTTKSNNQLLSIKSSDSNSLTIMFRVNKPASFYKLINTLENKNSIDRVALSFDPNNKSVATLLLYLNKRLGKQS